jgi:hypothetical protein
MEVYVCKWITEYQVTDSAAYRKGMPRSPSEQAESRLQHSYDISKITHCVPLRKFGEVRSSYRPATKSPTA